MFRSWWDGWEVLGATGCFLELGNCGIVGFRESQEMKTSESAVV